MRRRSLWLLAKLVVLLLALDAVVVVAEARRRVMERVSATSEHDAEGV